MKTKDMRDIQNKILPFIKRFNLVIFIVMVVIILSVAVLMLYGVVDKASGTDLSPSVGSSSNFDQATIDKIKELKTSDQPSTPLNMSRGRINPFNE